jgi:CRP/FNR family cyclic AMP-dependent transcriptional regulator
VPDFSTLDDGVLLKVVGASANLFWPADSVVFEAGSPSEALYVVLSGRVRISEDGVGGNVVAEIGPGEYFGEISMLRNSRHTKTAQAIDDCEILVLPKRSFEALLQTDDDLADHVRRKRIEELPESELS